MLKTPAGNSTYPKGGVSCFADTFVVAESSVLRMKFSCKNPALRVAANRCTPLFTTSMRFITIFLTALTLTTASFGQQDESQLLKAYEENSNKKLQAFIESWSKETTLRVDSNDIRLNDTLKNIYEILNAFNAQIYHTKARCILIQENLRYNIVDFLNKDTLVKRAIFKEFRKNPDSVYRKAILNSQYFDYILQIIEDNGEDTYFTFLKKGTIKLSAQSLKFEGKRILVLTNKYVALLSNYLLDNSVEKSVERTKRLNFLNDNIEFCSGQGGHIRIENCPFSNLSLTVDSLYQNAIITYRCNSGGAKSTLKKIDSKWTFIEVHRTSIE
jgi:hypothetical protein